MKDRYYVLKDEERVARVAKISDGLPYGYEGGEWVFMPGLAKIQYDDTDYEEISEEEANKLIGE